MKRICDACGREADVDVINTSTLAGVCVCQDCSQPTKEETMDKKKVIEQLEKAFYVGRLSRRERQIENSLHFTGMMLSMEKELYSVLLEEMPNEEEENE